MTEIRIDFDELTLGEVEEFEELAGVPFSSIDKGMPARAMTVLVFLVLRRTNPGYTLDDARQEKVSAIARGMEATPDPTPAPALAGGDG